MPRARRHFISGYVWHITHRCHKRDFLLRFGRDRQVWMNWLFEARRRYGLSVLDFIVTSNHTHLLVSDHHGKDVIPRSMQLISGRTAQQYNLRKMRKGAFWQDRYHATVIATDDHLMRCMAYIDLNMVRAGVVDHPSKWRWSGYCEIQSPRQRYRLIDRDMLNRYLGCRDDEGLNRHHRNYIEAVLAEKKDQRDAMWTQGVAVGSHAFIEEIQSKMGVRVKHRRVRPVTPSVSGSHELREEVRGYGRLTDRR